MRESEKYKKSNLLAYITKHWQGKLSFTISFWVNLVVLRILIFKTQELLLSFDGYDYHAHQIPILILTVFFHSVVFIWQAVGVVRAGEKFIRERGSITNHWGAQFVLIIFFWQTASQALQIWDTAQVPPIVTLEQKPDYSFDLSKNGQHLLISGTIAPGISRDFKAFLQKHSAIKTIILNSEGGNIYEARGLVKIIQENQLNTHVNKNCSSACSVIYSAGKFRTILVDALLGFHRYRINANYPVPNVDASAEQRKDREIFKKSNISISFLNKIEQTPTNQIWNPSNEQLLKANVVHRVISPSSKLK